MTRSQVVAGLVPNIASPEASPCEEGAWLGKRVLIEQHLGARVSDGVVGREDSSETYDPILYLVT